MNIEDCPSFEGCSAPLCPMDTDSLPYAVFYPDEDICNKNGIKPDWVKKQRKIKKKARDRETYYTIEMLNSIKSVTSAVRGLDADGRRTEEVFISRRSKPSPTATMPLISQKVPLLTSERKTNTPSMPKRSYQPSLIDF